MVGEEGERLTDCGAEVAEDEGWILGSLFMCFCLWFQVTQRCTLNLCSLCSLHHHLHHLHSMKLCSVLSFFFSFSVPCLVLSLYVTLTVSLLLSLFSHRLHLFLCIDILRHLRVLLFNFFLTRSYNLHLYLFLPFFFLALSLS